MSISSGVPNDSMTGFEVPDSRHHYAAWVRCKSKEQDRGPNTYLYRYEPVGPFIVHIGNSLLWSISVLAT